MSSQTLDRLANAPLAEILRLLLRQLDDALTHRDYSLMISDSRQLVFALEAAEPSDRLNDLVAILIRLIEDSLKTLRDRLSVDFAGSLAADITQLAAWESTADLLSIANDKAIAEQEILIASALLVACGRSEYASYLIDVIEDDAGLMDVDAVIARRILLHVGAIDGTNAHLLSQARAWLQDQSRG